MKNNILFIFLISFTFLLGLSSCGSSKNHQAQEGTLDLSKEKLETNFSISLGGTWEFYWNKLYSPKDFINPSFSRAYIHVPSSWTQQKNAQNVNYPNQGFATYRLVVTLPKYVSKVDILHPPVWFAERSWVNGKLLPRPDKFIIKDSLRQTMYSTVQTVEVIDHKVDLVIQVYNANFFIAGLLQNFKIGAQGELVKQKQVSNARHLMWLGVLYALGVYHLILYFFRRKNRSTLYFGIICFLIGIRLSVFGNHYIYEYLRVHSDLFSNTVQVKTYYMTNALLVAFGLLYVKQLYPKDTQHKIVISKLLKAIGSKSITDQDETRLDRITLIKISTFILGGFSIITALVPISAFSYIFIPMQVFVVVFAAYLAIILIMSVIRRRSESGFQFIGVLTMILAGINDAAYAFGIFITKIPELLSLAFGIFLSLQFIVIARRFSRAFSDVEDLSSNLERKVIQRTTKITQQKKELELQGTQLASKNKELEKSNKHITDSVRYARRIQRAILGNENTISEQFKEAFIMLLPKDIVSGDFYFYDQKDNLQILIAADCTGHGVPGAFMTIMGYNFLEDIITHDEINDPAEILYELDRKVAQSLQKNQQNSAHDGMDISILVIDTSKKVVRYAGAKNPLYRVCINHKMHQYKGSNSPIGGTSRLQKNKSFETIRIDYEPSEVFYIFSDGYQDQFGGQDGRKYLKKNFRAFLLQISHKPMGEQKKMLRQEIKKWQGYQTQTDDILVIGVRL